jgi:Aminotransferase class-V
MHTHPGLTGGPIYLDYNATTPVDPRVIDTMLPYLRSHFGNPSSGHHYGTAPAEAVAAARAQVGGLVGARTEEIVFTGSGSEANNNGSRPSSAPSSAVLPNGSTNSEPSPRESTSPLPPTSCGRSIIRTPGTCSCTAAAGQRTGTSDGSATPSSSNSSVTPTRPPNRHRCDCTCHVVSATRD